MARTRIKICGLTTARDVQAAVLAGADAVGFVLYPQSPRAVSVMHAKELIFQLPPFVTPVALMVNAAVAQVNEVCTELPQAVLQFHGDDAFETPAYCQQFQRKYMKAARIKEGFDLLEYATRYHQASAILLDRFHMSYGGSGLSFDWDVINWSLYDQKKLPPLVLSGGLTLANVAQGISTVQPWGVDVSSGVEQASGIKDAKKINDFINAVRKTDSTY